MNPKKNSSLLIQFIYWCLTAIAAFVLLALTSPNSARAREIVIVQSLDLSGQSNLGKDFSNGIRTYIDAVNARGGVRGRKISLLQLDDSGDPQQTIANLQQLIKENEADGLIGPTSARSYLAVAGSDLLRSTGLTMLGAPTGARASGAGNSRALTIRASYADEARQLLSHIATMQIKRVALVRGEGEEAEFAATALREEAKRRNLALEFDGDTPAWQKRNTINANIEAVVIAGDAVGVSTALAHTKQTARNANVFGFSTIDHRTLLEIAKQAAIGMVISQAMPSAEKNVYPFQREHRDLMKRYRDEPPSLHTLEGYVVARVLIAALETIPGEPTAATVTAALRSARDLDLGAINVSTRIPENAMRFVNLSAVSKKGALIE
jgi:branched-chain amino acid transport system substrate-binding protein